MTNEQEHQDECSNCGTPVNAADGWHCDNCDSVCENCGYNVFDCTCQEDE